MDRPRSKIELAAGEVINADLLTWMGFRPLIVNDLETEDDC